MSYIDRLNAIASQKQPQGSLTQPTEPARSEAMSVVSVRSGGTFANPREALATWRAKLAVLNPDSPLPGLDARRWDQLLRDATWLLDNFGQQAARDGWSDRDLFGLLPGLDTWGGVADRLRGSRSLVMTAQRAGWRRVVNGTPDSFVRGAGDRPRLVPLWEVFNA